MVQQQVADTPLRLSHNNTILHNVVDEMERGSPMHDTADAFPAPISTATPTVAIPETAEKEIDRKSQERILREKAMQSMKTSRGNKSSTPSVSTCHLRIDNFQRPLNIRTLRAWIEEKTGMSILEANLWLNSIKTHCYVTFANTDEAQTCQRIIHGERFPTSNVNTLVANFSAVSAAEAPSAAEASLRLADWQSARNSAPVHAAVRQQESSESKPSSLRVDASPGDAPTSLGKRKLPAGAMFGVVQNTLKAAADGRGERKSPRVQRENSMAAGDDLPLDSSGGYTTRRYLHAADPSDHASQSASTNPLDELFRKTTTAPHLYWLPVSDDQVRRRQEKMA